MSDKPASPEGGKAEGRVFVSYSRDDAEFASRLVGALAELGVDSWIDEQRIEAGEKWSEAIQRGLDASELMIVVLSPTAMDSENVRDEWQYFIDHGKSLIPVLLEPAKVHFQLSRIQYVDFHERPFDEALVDLCLELERKGVDVPGFDAAGLAEVQRDEGAGDTAERVAVATAARVDAPGSGKPSLLRRPLTWVIGVGLIGLLAAAIVFGPGLASTTQQGEAPGAGDDTAASAPPGSQAGSADPMAAVGDGSGAGAPGSSSEGAPAEGGAAPDAEGSGGDDEPDAAGDGAGADGVDPRVARSPGDMVASGNDMARSGHLGGHIDAVHQGGSRAYVGVGPSLVVMDLADPAHPLPIGRINLPAEVHAVTVADGLAHVAAGAAGLRLIDVSDPVNPKEKGNLPTESIVEDVATSGDLAVIVDSAGLRTVDVSDPGEPIESGLALLPGHASAVAVSGDHAYVVTGAGSDALRVIDIRDASTPAEVGSLELSAPGRDVVVIESTAVVAGPEGLTVIDVSDPTTPVVVAESSDMRAGTLAASGTKVYATGDSGELQVFDLADPTEPTLLGKAAPNEAGGGVDISVGGGYALIADGALGLHVVRVADPTAPEAVGFYEELGDTRAVATVDGDLMVVANGRHGLALVDVSRPDKPAVQGRADITATIDVALLADHIVAAVGAGDLHLIDVSDPSAPATIATLETLGKAKSVAASGGTLVLGDGSEGLRIYDATDPTDVATASVFSAPGDVASVAVVSSTVYLADVSASELWVIDISDPEAPVEVARAGVPGISAVAAADGYLCVGDLNGNLRVWDITSPQKPLEIEGVLSGPPVTDILVSGGLAYVTDAAGVHIVDVSDPDGPVEIAYHTTPGSAAAGIALSGESVVVVGGGGGMCLMAHEPSGEQPE